MKAITGSILQTSLGPGPRKRLSQYQKRLSRDNDKVVFDDRAIDLLYEYAYSPGKIKDVIEYLDDLKDLEGVPWGRSIKSYKKLEELVDLFEGFGSVPSFQWNRHYRVSVERLKRVFSQAKLKALQYHSDQDIADAITNLDTSTGWYSIEANISKKSGAISGIYSRLKLILAQAQHDGTFNRPIVLAYRTQCSGAFNEDGEEQGPEGVKHKTRPVMMVDLYQLVCERAYAKPILNWMKDNVLTAVGKDDGWISRWMSFHRMQGRNWVTTDVSHYDSSLPGWLLNDAFEILHSMFVKVNEDTWEAVRHDFIHKTILSADNIIESHHGTPSGSGFTTIVNCVCRLLIAFTIEDKFQLKHFAVNVLGDDEIFWTSSRVDDKLKAEISSYVTKNFGVKMNAGKCVSGNSREDPEYLSRFWTAGGPTRDWHQVVSLLAYPERFRDYDGIDNFTPEMVLYSYYLCYPVAMNQIMNMGLFLASTGLTKRSIVWNREQLMNVPYNVRLKVEEFSKVRSGGVYYGSNIEWAAA